MLVLSRRVLEEICIGDDIVISVVEIKGTQVRIGIEAPKGVRILRREIQSRMDAATPGERDRLT